MKTRRQAAYSERNHSRSCLEPDACGPLWADPPKDAAPPPPSMANVQSAYGQLPLSFEANEGQTASHV